MESRILYRKQGHTGYITLHNTEMDNRIDLPMAQELAELSENINLDQEIYLVVLTGSDGVFCTGGDIRDWSIETGFEQLSPSGSIASLECPVIAAINGDAVSEGLELALACDLRIAVDNARFGLPQIQNGYIPLDGGTQRLSRITGRGKALELILSGELIDAETALEIGLVNRLTSPSSLTAEIEALAGLFSAKAPLAMRSVKEAVNKGLDLTLEQGLRLEADLYFLLHTTSDRTEGIRSFLEKRPPEYKGK